MKNRQQQQKEKKQFCDGDYICLYDTHSLRPSIILQFANGKCGPDPPALTI